MPFEHGGNLNKEISTPLMSLPGLQSEEIFVTSSIKNNDHMRTISVHTFFIVIIFYF